MTNLLPEIFQRPGRKLSHLPSDMFFHPWSNFFDEGFLQEFSHSGVGMYEENGQLCVEVPLPGLNPNDIEVSLNQGVLLIRGSSQQEENDKKRKYYHSSKRNYSYSFALPAQIDENQEPQATYTDGILTIILKIAGQSGTKKINVKTGSKSNTFVKATNESSNEKSYENRKSNKR